MLALVCLVCSILTASGAASASRVPGVGDDPDELYRHREDLTSAAKAADIWAGRASTDYDSAWKLAQVCYWLGTHLPERARRGALERGIGAGETALRLDARRPEGHFWLAANMGTLAESFGVLQGLKYRSRIRDELERVLSIQPGWHGGFAEAALGQWYHEVPRLFGGSRSKAEEQLRRALTYDSQNLLALLVLSEVVADDGRRDEARALLQRVLDASVDPEWAPEENDYKRKAAQRLKSLAR